MRRDHLPILILVAATALGLTLFAPYAWLVLLTDGLLATAVIAAAAGWGAWPTAWLGLSDRNYGQQLCIAAALGLGLLSTLTLILGATALLNRPVAWTVIAMGGMLGLARIYLAQRARNSQTGNSQTGDSQTGRTTAGNGRRPLGRPIRARSASDGSATTGGDASSLAQPGAGHVILRSAALLILAVPLVVALFGASLPPGMLWQEEANGYDVLEYHLQGPREYYDAGRITFLPHNVYTSFPQQMEMLYLLLMHLAGGAYLAAIPAQLLHAGCGILAVVALGCWTPSGWARCLVVLLAGSTPWLAYVGCLAYVENGMLLFAAVAVGLVTDYFRGQTRCDWRTALTAGLAAGLAGGCKYTAVVFVAVGLGLAWLVTMRAAFKPRAVRIALFAIGALLGLSPWLVRNVAFTGNPVHPFAYEWFGGKAWSTEQTRQWSAGHRVPPEHDSLVGRLTIAARELFGSVGDQPEGVRPAPPARQREFQASLFGQVLFLLAAAGIVIGWSRWAAMLTLWSALILISWIAFTFIPGRFAMPIIVPLALLATGAVDRDRPADRDLRSRWRRWPVLLIALAGALLNDLSLAGRLRDHHRRWTARTNTPLRMLMGRTDAFVSGHTLNQTLPANAYAWLVGDAAVFYIHRRIHYTVPFSRDPWLGFAAHADPQECLDWLRSRNASHLVFSWGEIERLRRTYGFPEFVTRDWVAVLEPAGLHRTEIESPPAGLAPVEIYDVRPPPAD